MKIYLDTDSGIITQAPSALIPESVFRFVGRRSTKIDLIPDTSISNVSVTVKADALSAPLGKVDLSPSTGNEHTGVLTLNTQSVIELQAALGDEIIIASLEVSWGGVFSSLRARVEIEHSLYSPTSADPVPNNAELLKLLSPDGGNFRIAGGVLQIYDTGTASWKTPWFENNTWKSA